VIPAEGLPAPTPFRRQPAGGPAVRGTLHTPEGAVHDGLVLTHGAGSSADAPLLVALARVFAARGVTTLRCDLPYRQDAPKGPPSPRGAARDREGLRQAVLALREVVSGRIFLGGHSYGGRQASMLAADDPSVAAALLLSSYPLHPPGRPAELRTAHFPRLRTPALFVHGSRDPFATTAELEAARRAIPVETVVVEIAGVGHDLVLPRAPARLAEPAEDVVRAFLALAA
jgi:hypothetical protein